MQMQILCCFSFSVHSSCSCIYSPFSYLAFWYYVLIAFSGLGLGFDGVCDCELDTHGFVFALLDLSS
jgi:hypothetical protein